MNTTPSLRSRLVCRAVRLCCLSGRPATGKRARHIEACGDCRQYFSACDELESGLRRDAARSAPAAPVGLERGIIQAVRMAQPVPARPRFRIVPVAGIAIAAAAVAIVALRQPLRVDDAGTAANPSAEASALLDAVDSISEQWWNSVLPSATTAVQDNALRRELDAVVADARSALGFLALNFLPSSPGNAAPQAAPIGGKG
ncbi:MAG: hypothetical protein HY736_16455 [Verrucomicrobia bacterium]|nr:hypothetical protein [Verrucomicrobiota bacterium]